MEINSNYSKYIVVKISILIGLINESIALTRNVRAEDFIPPLLTKLVFHSSSLLKLSEGTVLPIPGIKFEIFDEPSLIILFRVIFENYLTFNYLFIDDVSQEEKSFRFNVWEYSGIKQRSGFTVSTENDKLKQDEEKKILEKLQEWIIASNYFLKLNSKEKKHLLDGKKPKVLSSWMDLLNKSQLNPDLFKELYSYKSAYSHSEYNSVLQIKSRGNVMDNNQVHFTLELLHFLICRVIIDLKNKFPKVESLLNSQGVAIIKEIEELSEIISLSIKVQ